MQQTQAREMKGFGAHGEASLTDALLRALVAEARQSLDGEAYRELAQGPGYRLSIVVTPRAPRYALVVLIDAPNRVGPRARIPSGPLARVEGALAARCYVSTRLDNGWMAHERSVAPSRLAAEWRFLRGLLGTLGVNPEGRA